MSEQTMYPLRKKEVAKRLNVSVQCLDKWVRDGAFIRPFYLANQLPVWDEADVNLWLENKKQGEVNVDD